MCSNSGLPPMGNIGLSRLRVKGRNRVPSPAAKTIAFIAMPTFHSQWAILVHWFDLLVWLIDHRGNMG